MRRSVVYLIGAGPGDPDLITMRGLHCLREADVVIHDDLIHPRLLKQARAGAELINVGVAAPQPMAQEAIGYLLAEKAREGKIVARLKWGDPFVFDRGGEEALYMHEQGIAFEVVPGLPAGIAVPAYAGIPVTYEGGGDTITLVRGYEDESRKAPAVDWTSLGKLGGTMVCYAGAHQLPSILDSLQSHGWSSNARGAVIYNGTTVTQHTLEGTLAELAELVHEQPKRAPAILVVGRVVGFREYLRWFDARPLFGRRVLVTRPRDQAIELVEQLSALGAEPVEAPMIQIVPPHDPGPLRRAATTADEFDWIIFTSTNAVEAFMNAMLDADLDVRSLKGPLLCAVGTGTADRLALYGIRVDLVPDEFRAEALVPALIRKGISVGTRVLLPHADIARDVIANELRGAGAVVTEVIAYRTILDESSRNEEGSDIYRMLLDGRIDVVTFTSASAVRNFARIFGEDQAADLLMHTAVATIGPVTAEAVTQLGVAVTIQPASYTIAALVDAIASHFNASAQVR